jgi:hypothetical protein
MAWVLTRLRRGGHRRVARVPLPAPFGARRCIEFGRGEEGWVGELARGREAHVYICLRERLLNAGLVGLNALHLLRLVPTWPFTLGRRRVPDVLSREPKRDWVAVHTDRTRTAWVIEGRGDYGMTVDATVVFARAVLDRLAAEPGLTGLYPSHDLFKFGDLRPAFEARGMRFVHLDV